MHSQIYSIQIARKITHVKYMDDIKSFAKNEKKMGTLIQVVKIYSKNVGLRLGKENLPC